MHERIRAGGRGSEREQSCSTEPSVRLVRPLHDASEIYVAADSPVTRVVREGYLPIEEVVQLPPTDVIHLMFMIIRTVTERAVVVLET